MQGRKQCSMLGDDLVHGEANGIEKFRVGGEGCRIDQNFGENIGWAKRRTPFDLTDKSFERFQLFGSGVQFVRDDRSLTVTPYALFLLTTAFGLFGLTLYGLGKLDARLKSLDFPVFNRPVPRLLRAGRRLSRESRCSSK